MLRQENASVFAFDQAGVHDPRFPGKVGWVGDWAGRRVGGSASGRFPIPAKTARSPWRTSWSSDGRLADLRGGERENTRRDGQGGRCQGCHLRAEAEAKIRL